MSFQTVDLFTPDEHGLLVDYFGLRPAGDLDDDWSVLDAAERVVGGKDVKAAVAVSETDERLKV